MDELRLEGVHDDGEHLVLSDAEGRRSLLAVDQQLRQAVQRARRAPARRHRQGADFGPRDIQARFRSGATVEEIVEESGWEPERVRRYEWPILAERGHMAREAQKVELGTRRTEGYRSAFEGAPLTLVQTLQTRAPELGIAPASFDWDAWQRPDLLWTVAVRFRVVDPAKAPQDLVDQQALAQWTYNPANLSVAPEPGWAQRLTGEPQPERPLDGVFGQPRGSRQEAAETPATTGQPTTASSPAGQPATEQAASEQAAAEQAAAEQAAVERPQAGQSATEQSQAGRGVGRLEQPEDTSSTEELLEVLDARRGQRLGADEVSDDQLAAILGRSMGHVDNRARPISAPDDEQLFQQPIQPARTPATGSPAPEQDASAAAAEPAEAASSEAQPEEGRPTPEDRAAQDRTGDDQTGESAESAEPADGDAAQESDPTQGREATIHHLGRADAGAQHHSDIVEITDDDDADLPSESPASRGPVRTGAADDAAGDGDGADGDSAEAPSEDADRRPRPKGRVGGAKRTRSSVPSWDDIVFGAKND